MMAIPKIDKITTHDEFRSPFVTPRQRQEFLLECAYKGFRAIRAAWPEYNVRMFVFGSTISRPPRVGAGSDLDIAISGLSHIADKGYKRGAFLRKIKHCPLIF